MHPFHDLSQKKNKRETDKLFLQAIICLSTTIYSELTFEEIYDLLKKKADKTWEKESLRT